MRIRIVGAGLAGLALAHFARPHYEIRLYSTGPSASAMGYGLLHPYGGARAKLNRHGHEGMAASLALIPSSAIYKKGLIRLGSDLPHLSSLETSLSARELQQRNPGLAPSPGVYIEEAYVIDMERYLGRLSEGLEIRNRLEEWGDITLWAPGAQCPFVKKVKGQKLRLHFPDHGLTDALSGPCYIIPLNKDELIVGATYERETLNWTTDLPKAKSYLFPKLKELLPGFDEERVEVTHCFAGLRATTPDHLPMIRQLDARNWLYTGLGSKGLLYHALYAKTLIEQLAKTGL